MAFPAVGCGEVGARLVTDGDDLGVELLAEQPGVVVECDEAQHFVAAFAVDADDVDDVTLRGEAPPTVVGPGRPLDLDLSADPDGGTDQAVDVSDPDARAALVAQLMGDGGQVPTVVDATRRDALAALDGDERLLVALPRACDPVRQELVIGPDRITIEVIEGETLSEFSPPVVAAMVVDADLLPGS